MTDFGWSYPAGTNELPDDEPMWCAYCSKKDTQWDADWQEDTHMLNGEVFCSISCRDLWSDQMERYDTLRHLLYDWEQVLDKKSTIDTVFDGLPEGDFLWEDESGSDPRPWECDCTNGWHLSTHYLDLGRKNGKRFIHMKIDAYSDGDVQPSYEWEEGEDTEEIMYVLTTEVDEYFRQWVSYWLDAYFTNRDVMHQLQPAVNTHGEFRDRCLDAAENNLKMLYRRAHNNERRNNE